MAKGKKSSPNKVSRYKNQFAVTAENKLRKIAKQKKFEEKKRLKKKSAQLNSPS